MALGGRKVQRPACRNDSLERGWQLTARGLFITSTVYRSRLSQSSVFVASHHGVGSSGRRLRGCDSGVSDGRVWLLGHTHQFQMWTTIKAEQGDRFLLPVFKNQTDGIAVRRADFQRMLHGVLQRCEGMRFQQTQDLDEFTSSRAAELRFQATPENPKADGQFPIFQWPSMIEAARFSFQKCQIMHGIEQCWELRISVARPQKINGRDESGSADTES